MTFDSPFEKSQGRRPRSRNRNLIIIAISLIALFFAGSYSLTALSQSPKKTSMALPAAKSESPLDPKKLSAPLPANLFVELGKLVNPATVSIFSSQTPRQGGRGYGRDPMQDMLEQFFGAPGMGGGMGRGRPAPQASGLGTGFIVREDGLILTNNHVVAQADLIKVQLDNNSTVFYEAEVLGRDARTDVAVLKIDAKKPLPTVQLGSSKDVQVGEWVAAFGNPYGHAHTMTTGIISAIGRAIPELNRFPFLQTDASINPGNSGGPLVNTKGLVVGINSAIDARGPGIGFAIPIDDVKKIVATLEKEGRIRRGYFGIGLAPISADIADQLGLEDDGGIIVSQVVAGGPAAKAGVKAYDIITEFNGKKIEGPQDFSMAVGDSEIGTKVPVKVLRFTEGPRGTAKKQTLNLNVTLGENPEDGDGGRKLGRGVEPEAAPKGGKTAPHDLGFKVSDETAQLRKFYRIPPEAKGPIISEVDPKGAAARVGLQAGDVILDVNREPVAKAEDVTKRLVKGRNMIRVARGAAIIIVVL